MAVTANQRSNVASKKNYTASSDSSAGFMIPPDNKASKSGSYKSGDQAVSEFVKGMGESPTKVRLVRTWNDYIELRNACVNAAKVLTDKKVLAKLLMDRVLHFLEDIYSQQKNGKDLLLAACNKGWESLDKTIMGQESSVANFGAGLGRAHSEWESLDVSPQDFSNDAHYQAMIGYLTTALEELNTICISPIDVNEAALFKMFVQVIKDLSMCGFTGEFAWESPSVHTDTQDVIESNEDTEDLSKETVGLDMANGTDKTVRSVVKLEGDVVSDSVITAPNYKLVLDSSPKNCGNCRFIKEGFCTVHNFNPNVKYMCDNWQDINLTATHTAVRTATTPTKALPKVERVGEYKQTPGLVQASVLVGEMVNGQLMERESSFRYNNPAVDTQRLLTDDTSHSVVGKDRVFLPNDSVYCKSLKKMAIVVATVMDEDNITTHVVINTVVNGLVDGRALVTAKDLELRSNQATRIGGGGNLPKGFDAGKLNTSGEGSTAENSIKNVKNRKDGMANLAATAGGGLEQLSQEDMDDMVKSLRTIYKSIKATHDKCKDASNVLTNKQDLNPLVNEMKAELEKDVYKSASTGPKRKYFRALDNALWSVGAARNLIFEGQKSAIRLINRADNEPDKTKGVGYRKQADTTALEYQQQAVKLVENALSQVEKALTLPSATHNLPAPGLGDGEMVKSMKAATGNGDDTYFTNTFFDWLKEVEGFDFKVNTWHGKLPPARAWAKEQFDVLVESESDISKKFLEGINGLIDWDELGKMLKNEAKN